MEKLVARSAETLEDAGIFLFRGKTDAFPLRLQVDHLLRGFFPVRLVLTLSVGNGLGLLAKGGESLCVVHSHIRQNLAVERDARLLQAVHKLAVRKSVHPCSRIDARYPQFAEIALFKFAPHIGIVARLHHRLTGDAVKLGLRAAVTLGKFQYLSALFDCVYASFDPHITPPTILSSS